MRSLKIFLRKMRLKRLVGKRVRHKCEDPNCPLKGTVLDVVYAPGLSRRGEKTDWWAMVCWDAYTGQLSSIPETYVLAVPIHRIEVIKERKST